jgi:hypothetical protein
MLTWPSYSGSADCWEGSSRCCCFKSNWDPTVFGSTIGVLSGVGAVASLIPALRAASVDPSWRSGMNDGYARYAGTRYAHVDYWIFSSRTAASRFSHAMIF